MDLIVSHSCPSCGGPVEMDEADRITVCPYCEVKNYMAGGTMLRFVLPLRVPPHIDPAALIYFPYLRFKGNSYTCMGTKIGCRVLDTTHQGLGKGLLPPSLGLRPQAMRISMVHEALTGRFVRRTATPAAILQRAEKLASSVMEDRDEQLYHRAFIGESVSCLYLPLYLDNNQVYDAVLNRVLGPAEPWLEENDKLMGFRKQWLPGFLAMICPHCGDAMRGEANSVVVSCFNCDTCWSEDKGKFQQVSFQLVPGHTKARYLPFWQVRAVTEGIEMHSLADLLEITNQPIVVREVHRHRPLEFWVPALKIRPRVFLTMAKSATLSQLKYPEGEAQLPQQIDSATLPLGEALQAIKSVIAEISVNRRDVMPQLPELRVTPREASLVYLPFEDRRHDLVQNHSLLSVAKSVIRTARRL